VPWFDFGREFPLDWLSHQRPSMSIILAARAALRVLPFISGLKPREKIAIFRATHIAHIAATTREPLGQEFRELGVDAADQISVHFKHFETAKKWPQNVSAAWACSATASAVGYAGVDAYYTGGFDPRSRHPWQTGLAADANSAARYAYNAMGHAEAAAGAYAPEIGTSCSVDIKCADRGRQSPFEISSMPLWAGNREGPNWFRQSLATLKDELARDPHDDWSVWTDWYDDRVAGTSCDARLELARATLPKDAWKKAPDVVNAEMRRLRNIAAQQNFAASPSSLETRPEYHSCFISYSSRDHDFAERLNANLREARVPCWFAAHDLPIGAKTWDAIDDAIRFRDKLLVILSDAPIDSDWVEDEVSKAFAEERERKTIVLFPIRIDDAVMTTREPWARKLLDQRHIGDFRQWSDPAEYSQALMLLLRDLKIAR
jgi:hypothetical protein